MYLESVKVTIFCVSSNMDFVVAKPVDFVDCKYK